MAIREVKGGIVTEADIGKYVTTESLLNYTICGPAWRLDKIVKTRCYLSRVRLNMKRELDCVEEKFVLMKSLTFICDTEMEGRLLEALSEDKFRTASKMLKQLDRKYLDMAVSGD